MKSFKKTLSRLFENSTAHAKSLFDEFNDTFNSFDWASQIDFFNEQADFWNKKKNEIIEKSDSPINDFEDLLNKVKESVDNFSVTVPFDDSIGEKISYGVKNGSLIVEVSYVNGTLTRSSKTSVLIPENCDLDKISFTTDEANKTATITIPKTDNDAPKTETPKKIKHGNKKSSQPLMRDSKGRFVRRVPKENS